MASAGTQTFPLSCREQLQALGANLRYVAHGGGCVAYFNYIIRLLDNSAQCWS
jgi:hypothetical protein